MAIAYFPSLEQADTLGISFSKPNGGEVALRLLVDSGFTGQSSFVLAVSADDLEPTRPRRAYAHALSYPFGGPL